MAPNRTSNPLHAAIMINLCLLVAGCQDKAASSDIGSSRIFSALSAPDPTDVGPLVTTSAEYQLDPVVDSEILADRATEVWGRVYMPASLSAGPYPLVMMLHGNHSTCGTGSNPRVDDNCQYTTAGTCPSGYVMAPSYLGYSYLADRLASWGYVVVSINANRGINCGNGITFDDGLVLARGRLVLKHLEVLSNWNANGGTPSSLGVELMGKLDFGNVGLFGHSRGGEGMRAAYQLYRDAGSPWPARIQSPVNFASIFEIGPVDGQSYRTLTPDRTTWNVLLPMCDGDIFTLEGVKPFDRVMRTFTEAPALQKSTFTVWGANHNFYNTEWQQNDSAGCLDNAPLWSSSTDIGSANQRQTALYAAMAFFRANLGVSPDATFNQNFNPQYDLPNGLSSITRVDRGYTDSPSSSVTRVLEDFTGVTGTSSFGFPNDASGITIFHGGVPNHDPVQRSALITWTAPAGYFETHWTAAGSGNDISGYVTLDMRVSRRFDDLNGGANTVTNFSIQLAQADGTLSSPVQLSSYTNLTGPVGAGALRHPILQTARIPLSDFAGADLTLIRGVRLTFDGSSSGAIYVANLRLSTLGASGTPAPPGQPLTASSVIAFSTPPAATPYAGSIEVRYTRAAGSPVANRMTSGLSPQNAQVELVVRSAQKFKVGDALPTLQVGDRRLTASRFGTGGDTGTLIFQADSVPSGEATLQNGKDVYSLGSL